MLRRFLVLASTVVVLGCGPNREQVQQVITNINTRVPPANYKEVIETHFDGILKDPGSKRVSYTSIHGSMVCGTVNAKNSYGGYVGNSPFYAVFDDPGKGPYIESFSAQRIGTVGDNTYNAHALDKALLQQCGFLR